MNRQMVWKGLTTQCNKCRDALCLDDVVISQITTMRLRRTDCINTHTMVPSLSLVLSVMLYLVPVVYSIE